MKLQRFSDFLARPRKVLAGPLAQWFLTKKGQQLERMERELLEPQLLRHFGSYILHYNPPVAMAVTPSIRYQVSLGDKQLSVEMQCAEHKWPVGADTVDVVVLQHSLDFAVSPHALLREAAHCLRPGGHLIIIGAHAWSFFGLYRYFTRSVWKHAYCLPPARIIDWLGVLGFCLEKHSYGAYRPLLSSTRLQNKLNWLERYAGGKKAPLGGCYMLVARKMVHGAHPQIQSNKLNVKKLQPSVVAAKTPHQKNFKHSEEHDR
ncbi:MAG TPA: class I SAM-dependent methyltransferase [Gammaproteobacteria bacterium]|nr:class I SAM-dependent methyltransferase [Gammaproteobacteria bacterium]